MTNNGDGTVTYTPNPGFTGTDRVIYTVADNNGAVSNQALVTVEVNQVPIVEAGTYESLGVNDTLTLMGTIDDDGLPTPANVMVTWAKVSGPGDVNFADSTVPNTTATFTTSGIYVLELSADDGAAISTNEATVTVNTAPTAHDDPALTNKDEAVIIDVVANDTDVDGTLDASGVALVTNPSRYVASLDGINDRITWGNLGLHGTPRITKLIRFKTTDTASVLFD